MSINEITYPAAAIGLIMLGGLAAQADQGQYNMSLQNEIVEGRNGSLSSPQAASVDKIAEIDEKRVTRVTDGVYRLGGWGLSHSIAVEGPEGWIIVDAGDHVEAAKEQREMLENQVGKIHVAGVLYTHSHYVWGAEVWRDEGTVFYGHETLVSTLQGDQGVSILAGNFLSRVSAQFGILHPQQGPDAFPNKLGFSVETLTGTKAFVPPSVVFKDGAVEQHTIGGMKVEVLPSKTDTPESVAFYFPDKKLLISNALSTGIIFNIYTLRGGPYRDPMEFVTAADLALTRDIEYQADIHGPAVIGKEAVIAGLQKSRDQVQLIHDHTYRAIAKGMDAQDAAESIYMPLELRTDNEVYGQVESHVKQIYGAQIGWMGWDVYDINPLAKNSFSKKSVDAMGGSQKVLADAQTAIRDDTMEGRQWALYLSSQLLQLDPGNAGAKAVRADAARALGQRTTSANARGWYISEALLLEGKMKIGDFQITQHRQLSQMMGILSAEKLKVSPLRNNVNYLRFMIDPRLADGKRAQFNAHFNDANITYALDLRNGIVAITEDANSGPTISMTKSDWDSLILGQKTFASLHKSLADFDVAIGR